MKRHQLQEDDTEINITPMLDIVFIMLIFFIVTTSFVREKGLDVSRPSKSQDQQQEKKGAVVIAIDESGRVFMQKREIDVAAVRANVERARAESPESPFVVISDKAAFTGVLIRVMDQIKQAGIDNVSVAAQDGVNQLK